MVARIRNGALSNFDWVFLTFALLIPLCGLVVLFSAGYDAEATVDLFGLLSVNFPSSACLKQATYILLGMVAMGIGMAIPSQTLHRYAFGLYGVALVLLIGVAGFGVVVNGSRRWLNLGGVNLQPAEFMKLGVLVVRQKTAPPSLLLNFLFRRL